jgi:hypothetical protein
VNQSILLVEDDLAIVKHVLARHDATLAISSEPGEGSVFGCEFPGHRVEREAERAQGAGAPEARAPA